MSTRYTRPFIILPIGRRQYEVFYSDSEIKTDENELLVNAFRGINTVKLNEKIVRVNQGRRMIVYHIFPSDTIELFSGRTGLFLVIGFEINRRILKNHFLQCVYEIEEFFNKTIHCCRKFGGFGHYYIPTALIKLVNFGMFNDDIADMLKENINIYADGAPKCSNQRLIELYHRIMSASRFRKRVDLCVDLYNSR